MSLRDYQERIDAECDVLIDAGRDPLVVAPTGSGKGSIIAHRLAKPIRTLFLVHLGEILEDVAARAIDAGVPSVRVLAGDRAEGDADAAVTIASFQTLAARAVTLPGIERIVVDEAHRSLASTFLSVIERHRAAGARLEGYTATAQRGDGCGLGGAGFTDIVQGPQIAELVERGFIAPMRVFAPDTFVDALAADPAERYASKWRSGLSPRPGMIFCSSLEHSRATAAGLVARGVRAKHVDSDMRADDRRDSVSMFRDGALDVLCNYRLFVEGVDVPRAEVVMLASAYTFPGACLQSIGRVRRPLPGKVCILDDLRGNVWRHGFPDDERTYHLDGDPVRRTESIVALSQCPGCLCWARAGSLCPDCGFTRPPPRPPKISPAVMREQLVDRQDRRARLRPQEFAEWVDFVGGMIARGGPDAAKNAPLAWRRTHGKWPRFKVAQALAEIARREAKAS